VVRAKIKDIYMCSSRLQTPIQLLMDQLDLLLTGNAPCHNRLVCDHYYQNAFLIQAANGSRRTGQKPQLTDFAHQFDLADDSSVAIEKCGSFSPRQCHSFHEPHCGWCGNRIATTRREAEELNIASTT
jgi:hypothetical protein